MTYLLEIEGELVRKISREVLGEYTLADLLPHIESRPPIILPLLPQNRVAGIYQDESNPPTRYLNIAITLAPSIRTLPFVQRALLNDVPPRLSLPWTIFVFTLTTHTTNPTGADWRMGDAKLYFSRDPLTGTNDVLIKALLPNIYENSGICWGNTGAPAAQRLDQRLDQLVNDFYLSEFTHVGDLQFPWPYFKKSYRKWAIDTQNIGALAYREWPDWTDPRREHFTLQEALSIPGDRTQPLVVQGGIPPMIVNPTFGFVEGWLDTLRAADRIRLMTGLQNRLADNPEYMTVPAAEIEPITDDEDDDDA